MIPTTIKQLSTIRIQSSSCLSDFYYLSCLLDREQFKVAQLFSFLASEAPYVITGQKVTIDGGMTMNKSRHIKRYIMYRRESSHELKMTKRN